MPAIAAIILQGLSCCWKEKLIWFWIESTIDSLFFTPDTEQYHYVNGIVGIARWKIITQAHFSTFLFTTWFIRVTFHLKLRRALVGFADISIFLSVAGGMRVDLKKLIQYIMWYVPPKFLSSVFFSSYYPLSSKNNATALIGVYLTCSSHEAMEYYWNYKITLLMVQNKLSKQVTDIQRIWSEHCIPQKFHIKFVMIKRQYRVSNRHQC